MFDVPLLGNTLVCPDHPCEWVPARALTGPVRLRALLPNNRVEFVLAEVRPGELVQRMRFLLVGHAQPATPFYLHPAAHLPVAAGFLSSPAWCPYRVLDLDEATNLPIPLCAGGASPLFAWVRRAPVVDEFPQPTTWVRCVGWPLIMLASAQFTTALSGPEAP